MQRCQLAFILLKSVDDKQAKTNLGKKHFLNTLVKGEGLKIPASIKMNGPYV